MQRLRSSVGMTVIRSENVHLKIWGTEYRIPMGMGVHTTNSGFTVWHVCNSNKLRRGAIRGKRHRTGLSCFRKIPQLLLTSGHSHWRYGKGKNHAIPREPDIYGGCTRNTNSGFFVWHACNGSKFRRSASKESGTTRSFHVSTRYHNNYWQAVTATQDMGKAKKHSTPQELNMNVYGHSPNTNSGFTVWLTDAM